MKLNYNHKAHKGYTKKTTPHFHSEPCATFVCSVV